MTDDTIKKNGKTYKLVEVKEEVDSRIETFLQWSNRAYCIEAVKQDGDALSYVKEQAIFEEITGLKIKLKNHEDRITENARILR
jgi:hypothetical protein